MKRMLNASSVLAGTLFILLGAPCMMASPLDSADRRTTVTLASEVLDQEREIIVLLPENYENNPGGYMTVYVLDADWSFSLVSSYLDYLSYWKRLPPMIVTGVRNIDRNHDYIPVADPNHPNTGGGDQFLDFVEKEWIGYIEGKYKAGGARILVGHSFGGVLALHSLFTRPSLFDGHVAISTSPWVGEKFLFDEAEAFFASDPAEAEFVYMASGEFDGGPTTPLGIELAEVFKNKAPKTIDWSHEIIDNANHFTAVPASLHSAFEAMFPTDFSPAQELVVRMKEGGADSVDAWFDSKEQNLGWRFMPQRMELTWSAFFYALSEDPENGLALLHKLVGRFPESADTRLFLARGYMRTGNLKDARTHFEIARRIAQASGDRYNRAAHYEREFRALEEAEINGK